MWIERRADRSTLYLQRCKYAKTQNVFVAYKKASIFEAYKVLVKDNLQLSFSIMLSLETKSIAFSPLKSRWVSKKTRR